MWNFSALINDEYDLPEGWTIAVEDGDEISQGDVLAYHGEEATIVAQNAGRSRIEDGKVIVSHETP